MKSGINIITPCFMILQQHITGGVGVVGSNPIAPTNITPRAWLETARPLVCLWGQLLLRACRSTSGARKSVGVDTHPRAFNWTCPGVEKSLLEILSGLIGRIFPLFGFMCRLRFCSQAGFGLGHVLFVFPAGYEKISDSIVLFKPNTNLRNSVSQSNQHELVECIFLDTILFCFFICLHRNIVYIIVLIGSFFILSMSVSRSDGHEVS